MSDLIHNVFDMAQITPEATAIGKAVRGAFAQAGLSIASAAIELPMPVATLSRRVNGTLPFTWPELVRVAQVTGVTVTELTSNAVRILDAATEKASA